MKKIIPFIFILILSYNALAQSAMTNKDVIEMSSSGLSAEVIAAKIRASKTDFDTSTEALKKLSEAKVPDSIIIAMLETDKAAKETKAVVEDKSINVKNSIPEQGTLADIKDAKKVYISAEKPKSRDFIVKELQKSKRFEIAEKIEDADFAIRYDESVENVGAAANVNGNVGVVRNLTQTVGELIVMMSSADSDRIRYIYSTRKTEYYVWEDNPAKSTTKQFLKDFEKIAARKK